MTSNLLSYSQLQLSILRLRDRISYQFPIPNYQGCASFNPNLLYISPFSQIALVADHEFLHVVPAT